MTALLCVGVATLDIVNRVARYPDEDSEVRAIAQAQRLGGNAANTASVLAQLGVRTSWVGNLAPAAEFIARSFARHGVDCSAAVRVAGGVTPTSYITLSAANGSRTIVHYRDLPEYSADDFVRLDLAPFDRVHFEGRAVDQLGSMLRHARMQAVPASLEVEKPRPGIEDLFGYADLLLFSHDYARARGFVDAIGLLRSLPGGIRATCTWGAQGAWGLDRDGRLLHQPAPPLAQVVDTVGAGDVFNAAMLHATLAGQPLEVALQSAVALATAKCGRDGLDLTPEVTTPGLD